MQGSNAEKEARGGGGGTSGLSFTPKETVKEQGLHEAKQQGLDMTNDPARDGPVMADTVGDTAKAAADGQWKAALETTQKIKDDDETKGSNRNTSSDEEDPNIKDLRRRAGGYDKRDHY